MLVLPSVVVVAAQVETVTTRLMKQMKMEEAASNLMAATSTEAVTHTHTHTHTQEARYVDFPGRG